MKRYLLIIPVLSLFVSIGAFMSCAGDEVLLTTDSTFVKALPVDASSNDKFATTSYIANRYLKISGKENKMLFMADSLGFMELAPVYLSEGDDFASGNYNFGWPVAAMLESTIIVSTQRKLLPGQTDDKSGKGQLLITSRDNGQSWNKPIEVQNLQPYGYTVGSQSCIGTFDGKFIQKGNGILISNDLGVNWNPFPRAFKFAKHEKYGINEPRIHEHPNFGLIFLTGTTKTIETGSVFRSENGIIWEDSIWTVKGNSKAVCPGPSALVLDDGSILMVSSNGKTMIQYLYKYTVGDAYTDIQFSIDTIDAINTSTSMDDVPDLIYNTVSNRIEMLESNTSSLQLWSIDKNELLSGNSNWALECILFKRNGIAPMHPAGTVIDAANSIQHIFLYIGGEFPDRNCIFRLSRTLDTKKLSEWVTQYRAMEGI